MRWNERVLPSCGDEEESNAKGVPLPCRGEADLDIDVMPPLKCAEGLAAYIRANLLGERVVPETEGQDVAGYLVEQLGSCHTFDVVVFDGESTDDGVSEDPPPVVRLAAYGSARATPV